MFLGRLVFNAANKFGRSALVHEIMEDLYHFMTLLKLRASVSDTAGPLLGSLWQCAFTRHLRFFQIVLPPVNTTSMLPTHDGS
jgi:hypothetical protein